MKIAVLDWQTVSVNGDIPTSRLESFGEVRVIPLTAPEETAANIADADIVLCNKVLITQEVNNIKGTGQGKIEGMVWTVRSDTEDVISAGEVAKVLRIEGVKLIVERKE